MCVHSYLKQMLVGQVVSGVEFKYEYMVDSCLPPAVGVDAWKIETNRQDGQRTDFTQRKFFILLF